MDYLFISSRWSCVLWRKQANKKTTPHFYSVITPGNAFGPGLGQLMAKNSVCYEVITSLISNINTTLDTLIYEPALMSLVNTLKICLISISNQQHSTKKEYTIKEKYG